MNDGKRIIKVWRKVNSQEVMNSLFSLSGGKIIFNKVTENEVSMSDGKRFLCEWQKAISLWVTEIKFFVRDWEIILNDWDTARTLYLWGKEN